MALALVLLAGRCPTGNIPRSTRASSRPPARRRSIRNIRPRPMREKGCGVDKEELAEAIALYVSRTRLKGGYFLVFDKESNRSALTLEKGSETGCRGGEITFRLRRFRRTTARRSMTSFSLRRGRGTSQSHGDFRPQERRGRAIRLGREGRCLVESDEIEERADKKIQPRSGSHGRHPKEHPSEHPQGK